MAFFSALRRNVFLPAALLMAGWHPVSASEQGEDAWRGLSGAELAAAVGRVAAPVRYVGSSLGKDGAIDFLCRADAEGGNLRNLFGPEPLPLTPNSLYSPEELSLVNIVSPAWWDAWHPYSMALYNDLYNLFIAEDWVTGLKGALPPGIVAEPSVISGGFRIGFGLIGSEVATLWEPADADKGDVARILMYMLVAYPSGLYPFGGPAFGYLSGDSFPFFTGAVSRLLMAWHRADPVSQQELRRNSLFHDAQGNLNPFVANPELAEYLWGTKVGIPFGGSSDSGDSPGEEADFLRASYSISDTRIPLRIPGVPDDAQWFVDDVAVNAAWLSPSSLSVGPHHLRFSHPSIVGRIMIEITSD